MCQFCTQHEEGKKWEKPLVAAQRAMELSGPLLEYFRKKVEEIKKKSVQSKNAHDKNKTF